MSNQTPASTSDARKRQAERNFLHSTIGEQPVKFSDTDLPPSLPDTSGWVRRVPGDVIEAGTRVAIHWEDDDEWVVQTLAGRRTVSEVHAIHLTPPPVEPAPWTRISTDRDQPTLARVTYTVPGKVDQSQTARVYHSEGTVLDEWDYAVADLEQVVSVELLHTYSPETHVPVERALIDEAAEYVEAWDSGRGEKARAAAYGLVRDLAALADGAQSKVAES